MDSLRADSPRPVAAGLPFYYGWVNVVVAALAMVGTLPGRTQGIGLITEPLLLDLRIGRVSYAAINLWATLVGALFCFGAGRLIDRFGSRVVLSVVSLALGGVVLLMSGVKGVLALALLVTLTRGLGQSALSVVSITLVGKWFVRRLSLAMAVYTVVLSVGFMIAFPVVGALVLRHGWRSAWASVGLSLVLVLAPLAVLLVRRSPEACGLPPDTEGPTETAEGMNAAFTLMESLSTPAFWVFGLASAVYGLTASGISLFNQSILEERGFDAATYHRTLVITALTALIGNFLGGWLTAKGSMNRLMAAAMALLAGSLVALPHVTTQAHVTAYALVMGLAGGFVTVIFFTYWSHAFGRRHLGQIQGAAQSLTVVASAVGPLLLAACVTRTGSYAAMFYALALVVGALGIGAWIVPPPRRNGPEAPGDAAGMSVA